MGEEEGICAGEEGALGGVTQLVELGAFESGDDEPEYSADVRVVGRLNSFGFDVRLLGSMIFGGLRSVLGGCLEEDDAGLLWTVSFLNVGAGCLSASPCTQSNNLASYPEICLALQPSCHSLQLRCVSPVRLTIEANVPDPCEAVCFLVAA